MGMFDFIGEAIGNAFSALAEFIGDAVDVIVGGVGSKFKGIASDYSKDLIKEMEDPDSDFRDKGKRLQDTLEKPIHEGYMHDFERLGKKHSEITPEKASNEVDELWGAIQRDMGIIGTGLFTAEVMSVGQIDRLNEVVNQADKIGGGTAFAAQVKAMDNQAKWLTSYERYLNRIYPNKIAESSDLVRFALREVWDPTRRPELLAENAPLQYYQWMLEQGYPPERAADWWASHWVLPSVGQLNEMMHRRVINEATWDRFVKYNDFDPTVRPWLKKISYNPYTRVDIRRMYDLGLVTRQEVKDNYLDLGYDEEHAEKMTVWTLAYVLAVEMRARYSKGWVTEAEVRTALLETGMPAERVNDYLEKIIKADASERTAKERDLTKTDITRSVKKGLLTKDEGIERLIDLGYAEDEAAFIVDITVTESISEEIEADRELSKADIIKGLALGYFTEVQGLEMLQKLGYDKTEAQYIIDIRVPAKKPEKLVVERDLTKAEIVKGVKKEIISWDQGKNMLMDEGYDEWESDYILAINVEALSGSPETWSAMQDIVNKSLRARSLPVKEIPSGIKELENKLKEYSTIEAKAKEEGETRDFFIALEKQRGPMKRQHRQLVEQYQKR